MRQQYPQPASAASKAGRKSAKALVRASSLAIQNWSRVCTKDAITSIRTALLSSPSRFRNGLRDAQTDGICNKQTLWSHGKGTSGQAHRLMRSMTTCIALMSCCNRYTHGTWVGGKDPVSKVVVPTKQTESIQHLICVSAAHMSQNSHHDGTDQQNTYHAG